MWLASWRKDQQVPGTSYDRSRGSRGKTMGSSCDHPGFVIARLCTQCLEIDVSALAKCISSIGECSPLHDKSKTRDFRLRCVIGTFKEWLLIGITACRKIRNENEMVKTLKNTSARRRNHRKRGIMRIQVITHSNKAAVAVKTLSPVSF